MRLSTSLHRLAPIGCTRWAALTSKQRLEVNMQETIDHLIFMLADKDVLPLELPRLLKDVLMILMDGCACSPDDINRDLARRGWNDEVLDPDTLELIVELIETECEIDLTDLCTDSVR